MFNLISEFIRCETTSEQCEHALVATNLGMQVIIKTKKALNNLSLIKVLYILSLEKEDSIKERLELNSSNQDKVKIARIEYRGKGQYIDEILK